jgi:NADH-quinone oxidoreductase subunit H
MDQFEIIVMLLKIVPVIVILIHVAPIMAWVERRGSAVMQNRLGPNRLFPLGLLYSAADGIKFIFKEDPIPGHVTSKFYYLLAPLVSLVPSFMTFAVIPFASQIDLGGRIINFQITDLNVGLLYIFSIASLGVYGIIMSGWASNNKYAMLGSLRSSSQMISYELSLGLSVIGILMVFSSLSLREIVMGQGQTLWQLGPVAIPKWGIFVQPVAFIICLTAVYAETNRLPFDLPEGESEIVAGYHLEYGSMKFAIFMMAEMVNMFVGSALIISLFLGGYQGLGWLHPIIVNAAGITGTLSEVVRVALEIAAFMLKEVFFMWLFVWVRWTIPRFRYDQLMDLGWKVMLPLSLLNIFVTGVLIYYKVI